MALNVQRWLGGSPGAVVAKLIFISLLVGMLMAFLGLTPLVLIDLVVSAVRSVLDLGFEAVHDVLRYVVYGAVIVVPIWLIGRVLRGSRS